ncbi:unnamed protein product [Protopolystoma xenopodis]|uniref:Uncharacterized protein n=1 Tax=Protopolystoma xenopodis TaxID=117903 RepID=A0A3S5FBW0_9PLAT|nr:unnamed protein product [Protopolystoma xenopodis]
MLYSGLGISKKTPHLSVDRTKDISELLLIIWHSLAPLLTDQDELAPHCFTTFVAALAIDNSNRLRLSSVTLPVSEMCIIVDRPYLAVKNSPLWKASKLGYSNPQPQSNNHHAQYLRLLESSQTNTPPGNRYLEAQMPDQLFIEQKNLENVVADAQRLVAGLVTDANYIIRYGRELTFHLNSCSPPSILANSSLSSLSSTSSFSYLKNQPLSTLSSQIMYIARPNWADKRLAIRSPLNLLIPFPHCIKVLPQKHCRHDWLPWQRLALVGGLFGFLETMETVYRSRPGLQLFTKLAALLPPVEIPLSVLHGEEHSSDEKVEILSSSSKSIADFFELSFLEAIESRGMVPDVPIINMLILRRSRARLPSYDLLNKLTLHGFSPDSVTWGCLAQACYTTSSVRQILKTYSVWAKKMKTQGPDLRCEDISTSCVLSFFATLLSYTGFNWNAKAVILETMIYGIFSDVWRQRNNKDILTDMLKRTVSIQSKAQNNNVVRKTGLKGLNPEPILPNNRIVVALESDITRFRVLLSKKLVPRG